MNHVQKILKKYWFILLLAIVFFASRLVNLNLLPVFADEAIYIRWAQIMWHDANQRFLPLSDGKPPLFMWLMIPFLKVITDPLLAGRLLSVLSGFATLAGGFFLSKKLFGLKVGLLSSVLIITSPFLLFYDRLAITDSLLAALAVWSFYLGFLLFEKPKIDKAMFLGLAWGAGMLNKPTAVYFPLLTPFFLLLTPLKKWIIKIKKLVLPSILASGFALGIYNVLRLSPAMHMIGGRSADYLRSKEEVFGQLFSYFFNTLRVISTWLLSWLTWPIAFVLLISLALALVKKQGKILALLLWCLAPFFIQAVIGKIIYPRYFLFITPFILIIAAWGLTQLTQVETKMVKTKIVLSLLFSLVLIKPLVFDFLLLTRIEQAPLHPSEREQYLETWAAGFGVKSAADYFINLALEQKISVGTEGYFGTLPDGLLIYIGGNENIEVFGLGQPISEFPQELQLKSQEKPTFLLVNDTRIKFDSDKLKLIQSWPKPAGPKGKESLLLFQVQSP